MYFNVNFNVFFKINNSAFVGEWTLHFEGQQTGPTSNRSELMMMINKTEAESTRNVT